MPTARITIDLSDDADALAEAMARKRNVVPGESDIENVDGLPRVSVGRNIMSDDVRAILDESD